MFTLNLDILNIDLPPGKDQQQLVEIAEKEIKELIKSGDLYGKDLKLNGRLTTGMALMLGHALAHICKSVAVFDPKMNDYVVCIKH
ncbi:CRISPR-associated protein Csx3 [candidate division KSB1 bacterium]|nr:CRISPR-associated protein Csx3 [candidate division KSB1 bacterium]